MTADSRFKSQFAKHMEAYVEDYRLRGLKTNSIMQVLGILDDFIIAEGYDKDYIDKDIFDRWEDSFSDCVYGTRQGRRSLVRGFLMYMNQLGRACYMPRTLHYKESDHIPYIYSEEEVKRLFKETDAWRDEVFRSNYVVIALPAIMRLLYSTGARIGETLAIRNRDVDFNRHVIYLAFTKNRCERLIPMNESLESVIRQYIHYRNMLPIPDPTDPDKPLFVNCRGRKVCMNSVQTRFRNIAYKAGIPSEARIHDLRHTACVHAMAKLVRNGYDIYCCLPMLSVYMGHKNPHATEYYLRLTKEQYPNLIELDNKATSAIKGIISRSIIIQDEE